MLGPHSSHTAALSVLVPQSLSVLEVEPAPSSYLTHGQNRSLTRLRKLHADNHVSHEVLISLGGDDALPPHIQLPRSRMVENTLAYVTAQQYLCFWAGRCQDNNRARPRHPAAVTLSNQELRQVGRRLGFEFDSVCVSVCGNKQTLCFTSCHVQPPHIPAGREGAGGKNGSVRA